MFLMKRKRLFLLALLLALLTVSPASDAQSGFQLIVNEDNPYQSVSRDQAADFFLKKDTSWEDGTPVEPVDLSKPESVREAFSETVLKRSPNAIKKYWQRQIFTGRNSSPPEKSNETEVISFVRSNRGAIGYVSTGARLGDGVRRLDLN